MTPANKRTLFVDASFYLSLLMPMDKNHRAALEMAKNFTNCSFATSQAVLGEVLTVGSQRFNKNLTIAFVSQLLASQTLVVLEHATTVDRAWQLFQEITNKNISWVDCYSVAIMEYYQFDQLISFDQDFNRFTTFKN